jgi:hypothetical protein
MKWPKYYWGSTKCPIFTTLLAEFVEKFAKSAKFFEDFGNHEKC